MTPRAATATREAEDLADSLTPELDSLAGRRLSLGRSDVRALVAFHAAFFALIGVVAALDAPAKGWAVVALVLVYNVGLPLLARATDRDDWFALWGFLLPVSVFQVLPDWVLAAQVGTLVFPDVGGLRLDDAIPLAMAGMWVPPLFITLVLAGPSPVRAAWLALLVFLGSELSAPFLQLWEPAAGTTQVAGVALYVLPAEAALGWAACFAFMAVGRSAWPQRVGAAFAVSTFYLGALVLAYFLIDVAGWTIST
ncbi:MAG: hypothetical protein JHD16_15890 [Solirubrobacteraceae bacterium]|nr:hypothetical protein [Solirubrobacteraceae bacterium]